MLICHVICQASSPFNSNDCGVLSVLSLATSGITWLLAGQDSFLLNLVTPTLFGAQTGFVAVYYAINAPSILAGVTTDVTFSDGGGAGSLQTNVVIMEVSGLPATSGVAALAAQAFAGTHINTPPYATSSIPTAGTIAGPGPSFLVVACSRTASAVPVAPGWTVLTSLSGDTVMYRSEANSGSFDANFGSGAAQGWTAVAVAFGDNQAGGGGGGGGDTGCGACPGPHLLQLIPGFSDIPDSVLQTDDPAFALHLGEIAMNATFGMVRMEVFPCLQVHGDTIPLPSSCWDGYKYSREELNYIWAVQASTDHSTNWISGPDSMWFSNWNVNQLTGEVFSEEWYERSSTADTRLAAKSNDGTLMVFTIAQRQKTNMIMSAAASYTTISEATMATDKPYTQDLAQHLSQNAKFSCVNAEFFYLGEYVNGQTVDLAQAVSPVDGYAYSAAECKFQHAWRWTSAESNYIQPPGTYEQAAPFQASINAAGLVSITVTFSTGGGGFVITAPNYGRIAAFAFCTRTATPSSGSLANNFTELGLDFFAPGRTVRASELLTIKRNIDEAVLSPEFFGPTDYADAATVALPTSPVDGYVYTRAELQYVWSWSDVHNNSGGTHVRLPLFLGSVNPDTGAVTLRCWRLPPGGPYVDDSNVNARIRVVVMATRQKTHPQLGLGQKVNANTPTDTGTIDNSIIQINGA